MAGRRAPGTRVQRVASAAGYLATELAKEAPYYAGAFGATLLSDSVSSNDALILAWRRRPRCWFCGWSSPTVSGARAAGHTPSE